MTNFVSGPAVVLYGECAGGGGAAGVAEHRVDGSRSRGEDRGGGRGGADCVRV